MTSVTFMRKFCTKIKRTFLTNYDATLEIRRKVFTISDKIWYVVVRYLGLLNLSDLFIGSDFVYLSSR